MAKAMLDQTDDDHQSSSKFFTLHFTKDKGYQFWQLLIIDTEMVDYLRYVLDADKMANSDLFKVYMSINGVRFRSSWWGRPL